jgi:hypothetical protein
MYYVEITRDASPRDNRANYVIKSFIRPTNAQLNCFEILKFALRFIINAPTCFGLNKHSSGSLQNVLR